MNRLKPSRTRRNIESAIGMVIAFAFIILMSNALLHFFTD